MSPSTILLRGSEAAKLLDRHPSNVTRMHQRGKLIAAATDLSGRPLFAPEAVEAVLAARNAKLSTKK